MNDKLEYLILSAGSSDKLEAMVIDHIRQGWIPLGGVSVGVETTVSEGFDGTRSDSSYTFLQAVTRTGRTS